MPSAKENFINRIDLFDKAVNSDAVSTRPFGDVNHNSLANIFRNGLAVLGFTILEDFIKNRIGELFKEISLVAVPFTRLPIKLQEAATLHSIRSIQFRANVLKSGEEDWMTFIQNESKLMGSTLSLPYELSSYSLGWDKSNLSKEDVTNFMSFLCVEGGWSSIQKVSAKASVTLASPSETFKNAATRRHSAAHNADANSPISDLIDYDNQSRILAFCFDSLISRSVKFIKDRDAAFLGDTKKTNDSHVKIRYIIQHGTTWKEYSDSSVRAVKVEPDLNVLIPQSLSRARSNGEILLVKSTTNKIINWHI
jgi:hypothetical protein